MEIQTKQINIYKKGTIPFKFDVSYTYFKGKLYIVEGGYINFKISLRRGFSKMFFMDTKDFNFLLKEIDGKTTHTEVYKNYQEFINQISKERKPRKPLTKEQYKKQIDGVKKRWERIRKEKEKDKIKLINNLPQINKLLNSYGYELYFKDYFKVKRLN